MCTIWRKDGKKVHIWKIIHPEIFFFFFKELHLGSTLFLKYLCRYFWLCWVSVTGCWLSLVVVLGCYSSRGVQASNCSGFSLQSVGSTVSGCSTCGVWAQWMCTGLVALPHRDQTGVPCLAQQAVNHWTTREAPFWNFLFFLYKSYLESLFLFL